MGNLSHRRAYSDRWERAKEFRRLTEADEIESRNHLLLRKLTQCKPNLTSTINADKFYLPPNKPMPYFPRRPSNEPKTIETPFTLYVQKTANEWKGKDSQASQASSMLPEQSKIRPFTANLFDPFQENEKNSKIKNKKDDYSFFQKKKRGKELTRTADNISKVESDSLLFKSSFKECQGQTIHFEISSFSDSSQI